MKVLENQLLVIFGATGDLTRRKLMPALFEIYRQKLLPEKFLILGVGRTVLTREQFATSFVQELNEISGTTNEASNEVRLFIDLLHYITVDTDNLAEYGKIKEKILELQNQFIQQGHCIFYLATPPDSDEIIAEGLKTQGLNGTGEDWRRIIVEKPFGRDLNSAKLLNAHLLNFFTEDQIYRIDHYLGKETVQNVMVTRFSNGIFEPLWNRNYISHVEITAAEKIGVENRGRYYDRAGALRDMVQNHLLQLVSLVAMEPPTRMHAHAIRNETLKVLQSVRILSPDEVPDHVIRGQYMTSEAGGNHYNSYRNEPGIAQDSKTETFVALRLNIENWRWGGVPFYIRTGKCLPTRVTEIVVHFKPTPHGLFCFDADRSNANNQLIIRIQPDEGILLKIDMKVPGAGFRVQDINLNFHYADLGHQNLPDAYQRLLIDCMQGDATLFTRGDAIEQAWRIVDPILNAWNLKPDIPLYGYPAGTWGPKQAEGLIEEPNMTWRLPCKNLINEDNYCEL